MKASLPYSHLRDPIPCPTHVCSTCLESALLQLKFWSEQSAYAALGRCRQNVVASINSVFSLSSFFRLGLLFSQKGLS